VKPPSALSGLQIGGRLNRKSHPQTTPPETVEKIRALALEHPSFG
jgi:hypothetical protein